MMIGCMRLTDVTRYRVRYDSARVTHVEKKLGGGAACIKRTAQTPEERLGINSNGKNGNYIHPLEGQFGREFPASCNHCGVMMA